MIKNFLTFDAQTHKHAIHNVYNYMPWISVANKIHKSGVYLTISAQQVLRVMFKKMWMRKKPYANSKKWNMRKMIKKLFNLRRFFHYRLTSTRVDCRDEKKYNQFQLRSRARVFIVVVVDVNLWWCLPRFCHPEKYVEQVFASFRLSPTSSTTNEGSRRLRNLCFLIWMRAKFRTHSTRREHAHERVKNVI